MIHITKDKVLITNLIVLNQDETCIHFEEECGVPVEITNNVFISSKGRRGYVLSKMALLHKPTFFRKLKLAYKYLCI